MTSPDAKLLFEFEIGKWALSLMYLLTSLVFNVVVALLALSSYASSPTFDPRFGSIWIMALVSSFCLAMKVKLLAAAKEERDGAARFLTKAVQENRLNELLDKLDGVSIANLYHAYKRLDEGV